MQSWRISGTPMAFLGRLTMSKRIVVIGGGAAGMMAAISAAEKGASVTLLEPNERLGKKLNITGKGRCNVTNDADLSTLLANVPKNGKFLYSAFSRFDGRDAIAFFEGIGVPLKTERGKAAEGLEGDDDPGPGGIVGNRRGNDHGRCRGEGLLCR